jgi:ribosomal protein L11 methyltransferase
MDWVELAVETTSLGAEAVSALLVDAGALGTQIIDRADVPGPEALRMTWALMDEDLIRQMPEAVVVKAWFQTPEEAQQAADAVTRLKETADYDAGSLALSHSAIKDEAWAESWKSHFHPIQVGRFVIQPSWEAYAAKPGELVIDMDPGMAFGTGSHETTSLCVEMLEDYPCQGSFLDIGTGSGILSIAAGMLGAKDILAVDIDLVAVEVARENITRNNLEQVVTVAQGDLTQGLHQVFDMAVANILADVILMLLTPLKHHLKEGGIFLCSGIIADREQDVAQGLLAQGYTILETRRKGDWVALAAKR